MSMIVEDLILGLGICFWLSIYLESSHSRDGYNRFLQKSPVGDQKLYVCAEADNIDLCKAHDSKEYWCEVERRGAKWDSATYMPVPMFTLEPSNLPLYASRGNVFLRQANFDNWRWRRNGINRCWDCPASAPCPQWCQSHCHHQKLQRGNYSPLLRSLCPIYYHMALGGLSELVLVVVHQAHRHCPILSESEWLWLWLWLWTKFARL